MNLVRAPLPRLPAAACLAHILTKFDADRRSRAGHLAREAGLI